jgi:hypothetical protein
MRGPGALANFADAAKLLDYGFNEFTEHTFANEEYGTERAFLLHESIQIDDTRTEMSEPVENEDASHSITVSISVPEARGDIMYPNVAVFTMTSEPPPAATPRFSGISKFYNPSASLSAAPSDDDQTNTSIISRLAGYLPGWLAFMLKAVFYAVIILLALTVCFRARRRWRRRRRRLRRQLMEKRRRIYREQQSFWS